LFDETQATKMRCAVEEACANVIQHAYDYPGQGYFEVSLLLSSNRELVIHVDDKGLPCDFEKLTHGQAAGMGVGVMCAFCARVEFALRGRKGKRVSLFFSLPPRHTGVFARKGFDADKIMNLSSGSIRFEVAPVLEGEASKIAQCAYRAEGYAHPEESIYDIAMQDRRLASKIQLSVIAQSENGPCVGHLAVVRQNPDSSTGQAGLLAIVPQLRGSHTLSRLGKALVHHATEQGMRGLHIATSSKQKYESIAFRSLGAIATGYWLEPRQLSMQQFFLPLAVSPQVEVYLPPRHAQMLEWMYRELLLERVCREGSSRGSVARQALSRVSKDDRKDGHCVVLRILEAGEDLLDVLYAQMKDVSDLGALGMFVDLPLESEDAVRFCEPVEQLGFAFSCLLPQTDQGDMLRLQRITGATGTTETFSDVEEQGPYEIALKNHVESGYRAL
jgi:anti-sigma regulatory factor (Ser/Thr protein kinase)